MAATYAPACLLNQVSITAVLPALLVGAATSVLLCFAISHGVLRTFMHARGVKPWTMADTFGSTLLLSLGSAFVGAAGMIIALSLSELLITSATMLGSAFVLVVLGALCLRLGLLALRKLT